MAPAALQRAWRQVVDGLVKSAPAKGSLLLRAEAVSDDGKTLLVSLPTGSGFALKMLERSDVRAVVDPAVNAVFGARVVTFAAASELPGATRQPARAAQAASRPAAPVASAASAAQPAAAQPVYRAPQPPAPAAASPAPAAVPAPTAPRPQQPAPQPQAPEPEYVPDSAYGAAVEVPADYPMPWDDQVPAPAAPAQPAPAAPAQPAADPAPAGPPAAAAAPADLTPEFSQVLAGLTAVFGAPTNVSVEAANQGGAGEDAADLTYDGEGADAPDPGFADEPVDDADAHD